MPTSILATKLYIPPPRPKVVSRIRLIDRLNEGLQRPQGVTLISAPTGFGKTTLVSEWIAGSKRPAAWLSLDEGDNDPSRFLTYLVSALQTIDPLLGIATLDALQMLPPPPTESILTTLINEIAALPKPFILVLDDYHVIEAKAVDQALAFLLEHLPPQLHLAITTRADPQLPLARSRARGQLTELRAADLRFTAVEAAEFLNPTMGLRLSAADITALETRTEGWIAGLQLAALALQAPLASHGQADVTGFIRTFAGDHRYIMDYLVEEVLQRQPEPVRSFLLQTAILGRLNGSLCDAVTGQTGSTERLEALERGNFFVVPLDNRHHWYRYHHLFAEVLRARLLAEQPDEVTQLHRRASDWYEQNDLAAEAIQHALAARDFARAASLVEVAAPAMSRNRQEATLLGWLRKLPDELFYNRPALSVHYAGVLLSTGNLEGVEIRLRDAERWLDANEEIGKVPATKMIVVDEEGFRRLPGSVAVYRAAQALALGNLANTVQHALRALHLIAPEDHRMLGAATALLGLASWSSGDLEAAHRGYSEAMAKLNKAGYISDVIGCAIPLADIRIAQGRLHEAMSIYERALQLGQAQTETLLRGTADLYVGMAALEHEHGDQQSAEQHLLKSKELGDLAGLPQRPYRWCVAMARLRQADGDLDGALGLLDEAQRLYVSDFLPNVRPVAAMRVRVWVAQGRLGEALSWAREQGLSVEDEPNYLHEFEHITLARLLLARHQREPANQAILDAGAFLDRLLQAAEAGGRTGSSIEILMLQALVFHAQDNIPVALDTLERALTLAEPEGYVRLFVDEGSPMVPLLRAVAARGALPSYMAQLLAAFDAKPKENLVETPTPPSPVSRALVEPLSQRELEVLRLFRTELSGPEIAHELVIALSTVRAHTKQIYTKLGVNNRRSAVKRAEELGLI